MPTANATARVRSDDTRIIRFYEQMGANRSETTPKRGLSALKPAQELKIEAAAATPGDSSNFLTKPSDALPIGPKLRDRNRRPSCEGRLRGPLASLDVPRVPAAPVSDDPEHAGGLNFVTKPPSSG